MTTVPHPKKTTPETPETPVVVPVEAAGRRPVEATDLQFDDGAEQSPGVLAVRGDDLVQPGQGVVFGPVP